MNILLDTHAFLWFVLGDENISENARAQIEKQENTKFISPASYWEIAIKISIGKYALPCSYEQFMNQAIHGNGFLTLPILPQHTALLISLPFHHRDPFDRLLISQAIAENMPIISNDSVFDAYGIMRVW